MEDPEVSNPTINEMESLANEVRAVLERLPRREKFDLSAPQGWQELLESTVSGRLGAQLPRETLRQVRTTCLRWQQLYAKLRFEALTRPVWNT